ncbi:calcium-binding protein CML39-like [Forsythia ovata]|uniref:Calcium-binding protein CML39-like n=1 Tax=Forsythia ovata TaxID=205694 RepID=A0ABD1VL07_9LAMI
MPIGQGKGIPNHGKGEMSFVEFKNWLMEFDRDKDGRISQDELREAVRAKGRWFSTRKSKHGVKMADTNFNGVIDDDEIRSLVDFARKQLGEIGSDCLTLDLYPIEVTQRKKD